MRKCRPLMCLSLIYHSSTGCSQNQNDKQKKPTSKKKRNDRNSRPKKKRTWRRGGVNLSGLQSNENVYIKGHVIDPNVTCFSSSRGRFYRLVNRRIW